MEKMETNKNKAYLISIIFILIILNLTLIVKVDVARNQKYFTYEDWIVLYNICQKKSGSKETLINKIYENKNTDFREFLLGK